MVLQSYGGEGLIRVFLFMLPLLAGGAGCVAPEAPVPQLQPSRSPSPIDAEPAPVVAHNHPSSPLPWPELSSESSPRSPSSSSSQR